jgi:hypothetical protein
LLVLVGGAGDPFEVDTRFSFSGDVAVTEGGIVGAERVTAVLLLGTANENAVLCTLAHSALLYNSSLLDELVNSGEKLGFNVQGINEIHHRLLIFIGFQWS